MSREVAEVFQHASVHCIKIYDCTDGLTSFHWSCWISSVSFRGSIVKSFICMSFTEKDLKLYLCAMWETMTVWERLDNWYCWGRTLAYLTGAWNGTCWPLVPLNVSNHDSHCLLLEPVKVVHLSCSPELHGTSIFMGMTAIFRCDFLTKTIRSWFPLGFCRGIERNCLFGTSKIVTSLGNGKWKVIWQLCW